MLSRSVGVVLFCAGIFVVAQANFPCATRSMVGCNFRESIRNKCISPSWECDGQIDCQTDELPCGFRAGYEYTYRYTGDVFFPKKEDGMYISTDVKIYPDGKNNFFMKLESPSLTQNPDDDSNTLSDAEIDVWEEAIQFVRTADGMISEIRFASGHPTDVLNIKKGIVSLLQMTLEPQLDSKSRVLETDVTGKCFVTYNKTKIMDIPGKVDMQKISVIKTNDYSDCPERPEYLYNNMNPVKCSEDVTQVPQSRMITECTVYKRYNDKKNSYDVTTRSCVSRERHEINISGKKHESPYVVMARRSLEVINMAVPHLFDIPDDSDKTETSSLLFSFDDLYPKRKNPDPAKIIYMAQYQLDEINRRVDMDRIAFDFMSDDVPVLFLNLVNYLRWKADARSFSSIYSQLFTNKKYRLVGLLKS